MRAKLHSYAEIVPLELELLNALPKQALGNTRGVLWHRCADSGVLEGEPFVNLRQPLPVGTSYHVRSLPQATMACAYSEMEDEIAEQTYDALRKWMTSVTLLLLAPSAKFILTGCWKSNSR